MTKLANRFEPPRSWRCSPMLIAWMWFAAVVDSVGAQPATLWEFAPYRVQIVIASPEAPPGDPRCGAELMSRLATWASADWGAACDVHLLCVDDSTGDELSQGLAQPPTSTWLKRFGPFDKLAVVVLLTDQLQVRMLDGLLEHWSPMLQAPRAARDGWASQAWRMIATAFQPVAQIDDVQGHTVRLRLRAAGLIEDPHSTLALQPHDVLRPMIRAVSRSGQVAVATVDWTLLRVTSTSPTIVSADWLSGYRSPLSGRNRGGAKTYALAIAPHDRSTTLKIVEASTGRPLTGYDVFSARAEHGPYVHLGQTDVYGQVPILSGATGLTTLTVKHGDELLARVPFLPGLEEAVELKLNDDRDRLEVEGLTIGVQEQVVDLAVQRQLLLSAARTELSAGHLDTAATLLQRLQRLPPVETLSNELRNQRLRLQSQQPMIRAKIERLLNDTQTVIDTQFDAQAVDRLERELNYKRKAK